MTAAGDKRHLGDGPVASTEVFGGRGGINTAVHSASAGVELESLSSDGHHAVVLPQSASRR